MVGLEIRLFTDEHIFLDLAVALRLQGYDVISCQEAGRANQRISDHEQLIFATQQRRAVITYNARDFLRLDKRWKLSGQRHAGIVIVPATVERFGELLHRVIRHLDTTMPEVQDDTLLWLA